MSSECISHHSHNPMRDKRNVLFKAGSRSRKKRRKHTLPSATLTMRQEKLRMRERIRCQRASSASSGDQARLAEALRPIQTRNRVSELGIEIRWKAKQSENLLLDRIERGHIVPDLIRQRDACQRDVRKSL